MSLTGFQFPQSDVWKWQRRRSRGGGVIQPVVPGVDPDAKIIIDGFPSLLTQIEADAINAFVVAEKTALNWDAYDEIYAFGLGGLNGLHGFLGVANAGLKGTATIGDDGITTNGVDGYVDSRITPSTLTNFQLNDAHVSIYSLDLLTHPEASGSYYGTWQDTARDSLWDRVGVNTDFRLNTRQQTDNLLGVATADQLRTIQRIASNDEKLYIDGVSAVALTYAPSTGLVPNIPLFIGAKNSNSTDVNEYSAFTGSFFSIGGAFTNVASHNTNVRALLGELLLDPDAKVIIDGMPVEPLNTEKEAISDFVKAEKVAGNWATYDEIQVPALGGLNGLHGWNLIGDLTLFGTAVQNANSVDTQIEDGNYVTMGMTNADLPKTLQDNWSRSAHIEDLGNVGVSFILDFTAVDGNITNTDFYADQDLGEFKSRINTTSSTPNAVAEILPFGLGLFTMSRTTSTTSKILRDGVAIINSGVTSALISATAEPIFGNRLKTEGLSGTYRIKFTSIGGALADVVAHNTNVQALLTAL